MRKLFIISMMLWGVLGFAQGEQCEEPSEIVDVNVGNSLAGIISCVGQYCSYVPKQANAEILRGKLRKSIFGSSANLFGVKNGYLEAGRVSSNIEFWSKCQSILDQLKDNVVKFDTPAGATGKANMMIWVKIVHIDNTAMNNLSFGVTGIFNGLIDTKPPKAQAQSNRDLSFAFGNLTNHILTANLSASKGSEKVSQIQESFFEVSQGERIEMSLTSNIYRDSNASIGNTNIESSGYRLEGFASIDESGDEPVVVIRDFDFWYSIHNPETPNMPTESLNNPREEVVLPRGRPYMLRAEKLSASKISNERGVLLYLENSKVRSNSNLMVFISGWPVDSPPAVDSNLIPLSEAEISELEETPEEDILKTAEYSVFTTGGTMNFDLIQFQLDKAGLSSKNMDEYIRITVNGPGVKNQVKMAKAKYLTTGKFQLPSMFGFGDGKNSKIEIKLEWANKKGLPSGHKKSVKYKLLHLIENRDVIVTSQPK